MLEETLAQEKYIGDILPSSENLREGTVEEMSNAKSKPQPTMLTRPESIDALAQIPFIYEKLNLHSVISAADFQEVARHTLTPKAWAFYSSAATDLVTHRMNKEVTRRIMFRPRVLCDVKTISIKRNVLGCESSAPFFISPAAMARLALPLPT